MKKQLLKRIASLSAIIVMTSAILTGCSNTNSENKQIADGKQTEQTNTNNGYTTEGKVTKLVPDETLKGTLKIGYYMPDYGAHYGYDNGDQLNHAAKKFKELYPNCELIIDRGTVDGDFQGYVEKQAAEIMGGKGPDVFWVASGDINKMMNTGVFANMFDYFENDQNFNIDDYYKNVLCGGQPEKTQYVIPTFFNFPLIASTQKVVEESGLDAAKFANYVSAFEEIDRIVQKYKGNDKTKTFASHPATAFSIPQYTGVKWIDYDKKTINLDFPEIKRGFELVKNSFAEEFIAQVSWSGGNMPGETFKKGGAVLDELTNSPFMDALWAIRSIETVDEEPVIFPWRNSVGKIGAGSADVLAVRNNCENKQAAYNFIKVLLNPEIQANEANSPNNVPVSRQSVLSLLERHKEETPLNTESGKVILKPISQGMIDQYIKILDEVEMDYLSYGSGMLIQAMMPYVKGEKSYEECINAAQQNLEIYVSE